MRASVPIALATIAFLGCDAPPLAKIGDTFVVQAADTRELPANSTAATVELAKLDLDAPPDASEIRLVADRRAPWRDVRNAVAKLEASGKTVRLLSAQRRRVGEFVLYDELSDRPIEVVTRTNGQACVRLPGVKEAKCVQRADAKHIDRAHLRQLVREAIKVSKLREVAVYVPGDMDWADVVRAMDAARTCCKETQRPKVELIDLETRKGPASETGDADGAAAPDADGATAPDAEPKPAVAPAADSMPPPAPSASQPMQGPGGAPKEHRGKGAERPARMRKLGGGGSSGSGIAPGTGDSEAPPEEDSDENNE